MSVPFFSVIIPCYNSEDYIIETLESVRQQTFQDFEIILIDDHSLDHSFEIASKYFINNNINGQCLLKDLTKYPKGVSGARNQGIDISKGEWICFLDSDDLFVEGKLTHFYKLILQNVDIKAYHHAIQEFEEGTNTIINTIILNDITGKHQKLPKLLEFNNICTSSVILNRHVINTLNNFNTQLNGIEDYYCWLHVSKITEWFYSTNVYTKYRVRTESLMGNKPLPHYITQNKALLKEIKSNPLFTNVEFTILQKYLMDTVMTYYVNNSVNKFGLWRTLIDFSTILKLGFIRVYFSNAYRICKNAFLKFLFR